MAKSGPYSEEVCDILLEEFSSSEDISYQESEQLKDALFKWEHGDKGCRVAQLQTIARILSDKIDGFATAVILDF